jgi:hypothetical protein
LKTAAGNHDPLKIRKHTVCHDVGWLFSDCRFAGEVAFPGLATIGMIEGEVERNGTLGTAAICARRGSMRELCPRHARIGALKTDCTGRSASCSTTTCPGSGLAMSRQLWPPPST